MAECRTGFRGRGERWEEGAAWLLTAWAEIALGRVVPATTACDEAVRLLVPVGDEWALSHAAALLGGLAQAQHRFPDAAAHLRRAADAAHHLGFAAAGSLHLTNLGRAHQQNGDPGAAITAFERAIDTARAAGDRRVVALARVRLGRVLRDVGRPDAARDAVAAARAWYDAAGGGDGARLAEYLAAALDADDVRLADLLAAARKDEDVEFELLSLDALARVHAERRELDDARPLLAAADELVPSARHLVTDGDRTDGDRARALLAAAVR